MPGFIKLKDNVGPGCRNRPIDVAYAQHCMNVTLGMSLAVDGRYTPEVGDAIKRFMSGGFDRSIAGYLLGRTDLRANQWDLANLGTRTLENASLEQASNLSQASTAPSLLRVLAIEAKTNYKKKNPPGKLTSRSLNDLQMTSGEFLTPKVFSDTNFVGLANQVRATSSGELGLRQFAHEVSNGFQSGTEFLVNSMWADETITDIRVMAYILATALHETYKTMTPVREKGLGQGKPYGQPAPYMTYSNIYYGRGYVQLTWLDNYKAMTKRLRDSGDLSYAQDMAATPDLALDPSIAYSIASIGMMEGLFLNGNMIDDYISGAFCDYEGAREVVNGDGQSRSHLNTDPDGGPNTGPPIGQLIADYARQFEGILRLSTVT
jgi:hypothetical protein